MVLYDVLMWGQFSWGLTTTTQNSICTTSDLDRSHLTDTRSAENDRIRADTDTQYQIGVSYFGVLQADCAKIRSLKLQRLKSQNQRDILYRS